MNRQLRRVTTRNAHNCEQVTMKWPVVRLTGILERLWIMAEA